MKNRILLTLLLFIALVAFQNLPVLPWWSFGVLMFCIGVLLPQKKWWKRSFLIGFAAGFFSWLIPHLYFEMNYTGSVMNQISELLELPNFVILVIIGAIGGTVAGLGLFSGAELRKGKKELKLEL